MEVDPGKFVIFLHFPYAYSLSLAVPTPLVCLLPYSSVPGMLIGSPLFFKAVANVTKQNPSAVASSSKGKDTLQQCKCVSFFCHFHNSFTFFLASLADFVTTSDAKLITHTHDVISNSTMADFTTDNAQDPAHYQTAVRGEITTLFHCLRVSLLLLDTLMESYIGSTR